MQGEVLPGPRFERILPRRIVDTETLVADQNQLQSEVLDVSEIPRLEAVGSVVDVLDNFGANITR